jgi:hypothetical protein
LRVYDRKKGSSSFPAPANPLRSNILQEARGLESSLQRRLVLVLELGERQARVILPLAHHRSRRLPSHTGQIRLDQLGVILPLAHHRSRRLPSHTGQHTLA